MSYKRMCWILFCICGWTHLTSSPGRSQEVRGLQTAGKLVLASDYDSLQAAFDALPESGGVVQLSAGKVEIHEPILVRSGEVLIHGLGPASHIHNMNTSRRSAFVITSGRPAAKQRGQTEPLWRVQLSNFRLTGNEKSGHGIEASFVNEIYVDGMTYGTTVSSNVFTNDRQGGVALLDAHSCTLTGNTFSRVPKRAVFVDAKSHATTITGNTFAESSVGEGAYKGAWDLNVASGIVLAGATVANITGNTFSNIASKALTLEGEPSSHVVFSTNLLVNSTSDHAQLVDSVVHGNLEKVVPAVRATSIVQVTQGTYRGLKEINPPAGAAPESMVAIVGATLIDGRGGPPMADSVVLVNGQHISAVGTRDSVEIPEGAQIVEATGLTLLPGLVDSHFHIGSGAKMHAHSLLFLQSGITSARDPGRPIEVYLPIRELAEPMPRLFLTGPHFDQAPPAYPDNAVILESPEAARQAVHRYVEQGASAIKVYFRLPLDSIESTCTAAHSRGIPVTAHLELIDVDQAILAGIDGIEHITSCGTVLAERNEAEQFRNAVGADNDARNDGRYRLWAGLDLQSTRSVKLLELIVQRKVFVSPTLAVFERQPGDKKQSQEFHVRGFQNMLKFVGMCHAAGAVVVTGSHGFVPHAQTGFAFQREMELLVASGLTPLEAISASTLHNARFLGCAERLGSVEPGKLADLVLVEGKPHEDIKAMYNVQRVMLNGLWVRSP